MRPPPELPSFVFRLFFLLSYISSGIIPHGHYHFTNRSNIQRQGNISSGKDRTTRSSLLTPKGIQSNSDAKLVGVVILVEPLLTVAEIALFQPVTNS